MKQEMVTLEVKSNGPRSCEAGDRGAGAAEPSACMKPPQEPADLVALLWPVDPAVISALKAGVWSLGRLCVLQLEVMRTQKSQQCGGK